MGRRARIFAAGRTIAAGCATPRCDNARRNRVRGAAERTERDPVARRAPYPVFRRSIGSAGNFARVPRSINAWRWAAFRLTPRGLSFSIRGRARRETESKESAYRVIAAR